MVAVFDTDGDGKIEVTEVFTVVKTWVEEWRSALVEEISPETLATKKTKNCDLNHDKVCNLIDLSILLYYIGR